jgi:hypothetical protein
VLLRLMATRDVADEATPLQDIQAELSLIVFDDGSPEEILNRWSSPSRHGSQAPKVDRSLYSSSDYLGSKAVVSELVTTPISPRPP